MLQSLLLTLTSLLTGLPPEPREETFTIIVQREKTNDGLVTGQLTVNGTKVGTCYENDTKKIPAGTYNGVLRTKSGKNFVQGPGGKMGNSGDFLVEVGGVDKRTDILFHPGNKKEHSAGCILCGPVTKDDKDNSIAPEALKKMRIAFYGTDTPNATPDKKIVIIVRDAK